MLPFHHQKLISNLFKEAIGTDYDFESEMFCFSGLKGQTKVGREGLHYFSKRVTIVLSSMNTEFVNFVIGRIFERPHFTLGNLVLIPEKVEEEPSPYFGESSKFLCISPLIITNQRSNTKNKEFIAPSSDQFSDYLYESTMQRMERSGQYAPGEIASFFAFQLVPDMDYLEKITRSEKKFARIYTLIMDGSIKEVRGYTFPFELYAHPKVQQFIYENGFGELTNQGFGMLDVPVDNTTMRKTIFEANPHAPREEGDDEE